MTELEIEELSRTIQDDPHLAQDFRRMEQRLSLRQFNLTPGDAAILIIIIKLLVYHVGLPWYHTLKRIPELYRARVDAWIDEQYNQHGIDPYLAREASDAVCHVLESVTEPQSRHAWEQFARQIGTAADPSGETQSSEDPNEDSDACDIPGA